MPSRIRTLALIAVIASTGGVAGCTTMSNVRLANASADTLKRTYVTDLCMARASSFSTPAIEAEVERRAVDCEPIVARERAYKEARAASQMEAASYFMAMPRSRPAAIPAPTVTNCNNLGYSVQCTTY